MDHIEDIHKLTFVLVDSLDHHIVHCIYSYLYSFSLLYVLLELSLAPDFHSVESSLELRVPCLGSDLFNHAHISDPVILVADGI